MANDIEKLQFVDKAGLEQFWADVQTYLTRNYKNLPAGMQFSRIYQANGQLHVLVEEFGGDTAARKEASRENLDVYSKGEVDTEVAEAVAAAIDSLDVSAITVGQDMTIGTISEVDGKIVVNPVPIVVGTSNIADSAVTSAKIADGTIQSGDIGAGQVQETNLADGAVTEDKIADGAVTAEKVRPGETLDVDITGNAATASDVEPGSELEQRISDLETGKKDKQQAVPSPASSGTTSDFQFISSITQDANGVIEATKLTIPKSDATNLDSSDTLATSKAVKSAIDSATSRVDNLDFANILNAGEYITSLSQTDGQLDYTVNDMVDDDAIHPEPNGKQPVTSGALYKEAHRRQEQDDIFNQLIPTAATPQNQLVDKAYVDAIGERLEARYLSTYDAEHNEYVPFPTYAAFAAAKEIGASAFYYNGTPVSRIGDGRIDNNDIVVITADEEHLNEAGGPSTTRYRYQCDVTTGDDGHWYFEYVINNTALNAAQLAAINSGITEAKRINYDAHLANLQNPHQVTLAQLVGNEGKVSQEELNVLDGVAITTAELNTLQGMNTENPNEHTVQYQLNEKVDRINPASDDPNYHAQNKIAIINDHDVINGRFGLKDSGAIITEYYTPDDQDNPVTGSAIHQAIEALEGTHSSTGDKLSITVATDQHGIIDAVTIDDSDLATAEQGAKADSAVQTVTLNGTTLSGNDIDLGNLKTEQSAVSSPASSGNTQDYQFISTVSQDTNGVITATKSTIPDADTNSTKGVVTLAGSIGTTVSEENRKAATEKAVRDAINDLNKNDISGFGAGKTLATLEENNGIIGATFQDIEITKSQVRDFAHSHGNIENDGTIGSDANKALVTTTDGQIVAGDIDGTYSVDNKIATVSTVSGAIGDLDYTDREVTNQFVTSVSETDGVIAVTRAQPGITDVDGLSDRLDGIDTSISSLDTRKADKVVPATGVDLEGHLAALDNTGNLEDSGYRVVNTYKVSDDKSAYLANPVTGTAVDAAIAESASGDRQYVDAKIDALDAELTSNDGTNVQFKVAEVDGKITAVNVTTDNTVNATDVDNKIATLDSEKTSTDGTNVQFKVTEVDGKITAVNVTTDNTVNATVVDNKIDNKIATLDAEETSNDGTNVQFKVTEVDGKITAVNVTTDRTVNSTDVSDAISAAIGALDATVATEQAGSPEAGKNFAISVTEEDGVLTGVSITRDDTVNSSYIDAKINALDVDNLEPGDAGYDANKSHITGFGADKTLATLTETDGKIAATFQSILVDTANIDDGAVTTAKLDDGAVTEGKIGTGAVTEDKIGTGAVTTGKIDDGAVTEGKIAASAVTEGKIGTGAVTEDKIYDGAVTTTKIADDAVTNDKIADNAVDTAQLVDDAVTTSKIDSSAVTTGKIADDAVTNDKIADNAVNTAQIAADAVTNDKIADNAVDTDQIADDAVTTDKIVDDAVTNDKIADDAVDTDQIADDAVTNDKIADNAVNTTQIADDAVTTGKIADDAVTANKVKDGEVLPVDISGNAATATVADDVIDGGTLDQRIEGIESNVTSLQSGKADKVAGATSGNFASLDANGNLTDSGHKHSDYKTKQTAQTTTGSVLKTVTKLNQNANGELDVEFSDIQSASTSQKGVVQLAGSIGATVESENNKAASEKAVRDAIDSAIGGTIDSLDVEEVGGAGKYISAISETDGKISATATTMDTTPTSDSTNAVTSGGVYTAINSAVNALDATVSGSSTNVSVSVTETDGKLTSITVTDTAATSDHVHGNISNDGKVGTAANKVLVTTTGGEVVAGNIDGTYNASTNKIATQSTVTSAINALDVSDISGFGADKTLATLTETDGKIAASFQSIQIAESQVTDLTTDLAAKEDLSNKVGSWSATTTDDHYPSEKLVKDSLDTKVDKTTNVNGHALSSDVTVTKGDVGLGNVVNTGDSDTPVANGTTKFTTGGAYTELNKKADKTATVSNVAYDGTNKKITKTINGTTSDVVTAATLKADMALDNVANTNITVSATDGVTDNTNNVTYKYTHPTFTATTAAAKKVGMNAEGHVVLGDSLTKADVGLDLVSNQTITVTDTSVSDGTHTFNKYVHPTTTATAAAAVKVGNDAEGHVVLGTALQKGDVGLGNVDNTSDANKPVSTAQQTALNAKLDKTAGVTAVTWDSTNKKITKTINGTTSDVVTAATLKTAMALNKSDVGLGNVTNDAQVKRSEMGVANGVATLDNDGKVPASQLPSYIDDVIEGYYYNGAFYEDSAHTDLITPDSGKIYVDVESNKTYRWSGSAYVTIASDLALGETSSTAYRGDRGKIAYDHSQITSGNPHNVTADDVGITVSEIDGVTHETVVDGVAHTVTYKYTHPTTTAVAASAKKVGYDNQGHVVLGDALVKGDVGLGNVDNTSDATKKTNFTGAVASGNTGFPTGDMVYQAIADGKECVVVTYDTPYSEVAAIVNADKFPVLKYTNMYYPLTMVIGGGDTTAYWFYSTRLGDPENYHTSITIMKHVCKNATPAWSSTSNTYLQNNAELVSSWSTTVSNSRYPSEKLVKTSLDKKVDKVDGMGLSSNDYTTEEKTKLAGIAAGAEVNQNAFSNVKVGSTTVAADSKTDTLELVAGSNVTITPDATNDKITIAATDTTYESKAAASGGTDVSLVTTGEKYTWNAKQDALATQTAYASKGSATKVPQITTNALGQVTGITEVTITGVTPASHTHGNITNAGALQTNDVTIASGDKLVITDSSDSNKVARASAAFDGNTTTKALTQKGTFEDFAKQADIDEAIEEIPTISLVGDNHITVTSDDTTGTVTVATDIAAQTAYTAKGSATKVPQITTNALGQVTGITEVTISGVTPASHPHGNITNDGKIGSTADLAVVTGTSGAVTTADLTTAAPSPSGTGTAFITSVSQNSKGQISASKANLPTASMSASGIVQLQGSIGATETENSKAATPKAVRDAINALDVDSVGGAGKYISAISETNGKISATATTMDTTPTANSTNAITSGGVASALAGYKPVQTAKSSPSASGNTLAFIDTISQDANGVITATKKNVTVDSSLSTTSTNPVQNKAVTAETNDIILKTFGPQGYISQSAAHAELFTESTSLGRWSLNNRNNVRIQLYKYTSGDEANATLVWDSNTATGEIKEKFLNAEETGTLLTTSAGECVKVVYTGATRSYLRALGVFMTPKVASDAHNATAYMKLGDTQLPTYGISTYGSLVTGIVSNGTYTTATMYFIPSTNAVQMRFYGFRCLNTWTGGGTLIGTSSASRKLDTARKLAVNLANTATDTTFDGSADQTGIKVSGTLPIANGGTGKTTAKAAVNALLGGLPAESSDMADNTPVVMRYYSPTDSNGALYTRTGSQVWSYVKGKMSSDTGVNISGNAVTATTATDYNTSSGTIKSALDGKVSKVANTTLDNNITTTWVRYGNRTCTISGDNIKFDMSAETGGWAGDLASIKDATKTHSMLGYLGNAGEGLKYFYIGGTYNDPFLKITTAGIATFKNSLRVPSLSSSDGTYTYTLNSTKGGELALKEDVPAAVSVKGDAETTYRTGQVNLTPANLGISATSTSVTVGSTTFNKYSHPAGSAPSVTGFPADGGTLAFGGTFDVNQVTTDSTSHVSAITKRTFTLPSLGTTATTAAKGNHTHTASIAADTGTSALAMTANTKYKLTAGGSTFIFTTPVDTTYTSKAAASGGTAVSLVTTGEKYTWNHKQDALTEMTTTEVSNLVAAFAS